MLKKTIKYTDYNGVERTEDFYFNLNEAELTELAMSKDSASGYAEDLESRAKSGSARIAFKSIKDIILMSYGVKSDDGRQFIKDEKLSKAFSQTEAYNQLFQELTASDDAMLNFVKGIIPRKVAEQSSAQIEEIKNRLESEQTN